MSAAVELVPGNPVGENRTPEHRAFRFLLACVNAVASRTELRSGDVGAADWDEVLSAAKFQGVTPIVHAALSSRGAGAEAPLYVRDRLRQCATQSALRNAAMMRELGRVLRLLSRAQVPTIPYKGPTLAEQLWGNAGLRDSIDLDIFVPKTQVMQALEVLRNNGYVPAERIPRNRMQAHLRNASELPLRNDRSGTTLELQWNIVPRCFVADPDFDGCWLRAHDVMVAGSPAKALSPEDLFLCLVVHGWKHAWTRLIWLGDLLALLRRYPKLDWVWVAERASRAGLARMVSVAVLLMSDLFEFELPATVFEAARRDRLAKRLSQLIADRMQTTRTLPYTAWHWYLLQSRERWSDRLRCAWRFASTPGLAEWNMVRLPAFASSAYLPIRLARLVPKLFGISMLSAK